MDDDSPSQTKDELMDAYVIALEIVCSHPCKQNHAEFKRAARELKESGLWR